MEPIQKCHTCDRTRQCYEHSRAEFPPDAAKNWLKRTCPYPDKECSIKYRAGIIIKGR